MWLTRFEYNPTKSINKTMFVEWKECDKKAEGCSSSLLLNKLRLWAVYISYNIMTIQ